MWDTLFLTEVLNVSLVACSYKGFYYKMPTFCECNQSDVVIRRAPTAQVAKISHAYGAAGIVICLDLIVTDRSYIHNSSYNLNKEYFSRCYKSK